MPSHEAPGDALEDNEATAAAAPTGRGTQPSGPVPAVPAEASPMPAAADGGHGPSSDGRDGLTPDEDYAKYEPL